MLDQEIDEVVYSQLLWEYSRSKRAEKYDMSLEEAFQLTHPSDKDGMNKLKERLGFTRQGAHVFYKRWVLPAYKHLSTPGQRRQLATAVDRMKKLKTILPAAMPPRLRKAWITATRLGFTTKLIPSTQKPKFSRSGLKINGYTCLIKRSQIEKTAEHRNYIVFALNTKFLKKYDFMILNWENERFIECFYIIPMKVLDEMKYAHSNTIDFNIPLQEKHLAGRRVHIDWEEYRDNWDQLNKPR